MGKVRPSLSSPPQTEQSEGMAKRPRPENDHHDEHEVASSSEPQQKQHASIDGSATQFSDIECLKTYSSMTSWQDFNNALPGVLQERLVRGAMGANGGSLPCFKCHKSLTSSLGLIMHLKRCRKSAKDPTNASESTKIPHPPAKRVRDRTKKNVNPIISVSSLQELKEEPSIWLRLDQNEKLDVLKTFFPSRVVECFAIQTTSRKCPTFNDYKKAVAHLDSCIQPMYLTYVGERASEFRLLDKKTRARYVREGMAMCMQLPCIECGRLFTHHYGLLYHVERCNVSEDEMPWKCYRCSMHTTRAKSHEHLKECWGVDREEEAKELSSCLVMGALGDVNLRSGKSILKDSDETIEIDGVPKLVSELSAEEALKSILGPKQSVLTPKKRRPLTGARASVSEGVIPEHSTRITISGDGKMRFKFRKADIKGGVAGMAGYPRYLDYVRKSNEKWNEEVSALPYCAHLSDIKPSVWKTLSNSTSLPYSNKESVGIRLFEQRHVDQQEIPDSCRRLRAFNTTELTNERDESVTVAYCGGPINAIRIAPNTMPSGEEVVAVVTYPCETTLVGKNMRNADGLVQFWLHSSNEKGSSAIVPWFVLKSDYGLVFDVCWLDRPRLSPDDTLIGYFAVSTAQGVVLFYRLDTNTISSSQGVPVVNPEPGLILRQPKNVFLDKPEDENSEQPFSPPIYALTWSAKSSAQYIVGVNAAGGAVIWDLQRSIDTPQVLLDSTWSSPVTAASFIGTYEVALAFRERLVRVYDVRSYECSLEENAVRTAGSRVTAQPRLFSGFFAFQSEYFATGDIPTNGVSFICTETKSGGYFVVPLGNRHGLMTWDVAASCVNATVASCGVDGRLLLSSNGRLVTFASPCDYGFSLMKSSLTLTRRRVSEPEAVNIETLFSKVEPHDDYNDHTNEKEAPVRRACLCYTTHDETLEHLWLDISLNSDVQTYRNRLEYSALDLRIESLNCVATNQAARPFVFTGGQAGLMFIRPCVIETELSVLSDLFHNASGEASSKRQKLAAKASAE
ncbi:hypothetical protein V3C99_005267 [Haemonchus contortus]|uniref:C2H2-type domain-containing protein n=1 Tax=Haemonchus contortus TaxID=6289 RepID=A0A7I4XVW6_HAECO